MNRLYPHFVRRTIVDGKRLYESTGGRFSHDTIDALCWQEKPGRLFVQQDGLNHGLPTLFRPVLRVMADTSPTDPMWSFSASADRLILQLLEQVAAK